MRALFLNFAIAKLDMNAILELWKKNIYRIPNITVFGELQDMVLYSWPSFMS